MFEVTWQGTSILISGIKRITQEMIQAAAEGVKIGSALLVKHAAANHPHKKVGEKAPDSDRAKSTGGGYRYFDRAGQLTGSIQPIDVQTRPGEIMGGAVSMGSEYGAAIEFGTKTGHRPFPFMRPAVEENRSTVMDIITEKIRDALK